MRTISEKKQNTFRVITAIAFIIAIITGATNSLAFNEANIPLTYISAISGVILSLCILLGIFFVASGLTGEEIVIDNKAVRMLIGSLVALIMIFISFIILEVVFDFYMDYREARELGFSREVANEIGKNGAIKGIIIMAGMYIAFVGGGRLFNKIWGQKIKEQSL